MRHSLLFALSALALAALALPRPEPDDGRPTPVGLAGTRPVSTGGQGSPPFGPRPPAAGCKPPGSKRTSPLVVDILPAQAGGEGRPVLLSAGVFSPIAVPDLSVDLLLPPGVALVHGASRVAHALEAGQSVVVSFSVRAVAPGEHWLAVSATSPGLGWVTQRGTAITGPRPLTLPAVAPRADAAALALEAAVGAMGRRLEAATRIGSHED